jgi:hypothetical protein
MKNRRKHPMQLEEQSYRSLVQNIKDYAIFMLDKKGKVMSWDQGGLSYLDTREMKLSGNLFLFCLQRKI